MFSIQLTSNQATGTEKRRAQAPDIDADTAMGLGQVGSHIQADPQVGGGGRRGHEGERIIGDPNHDLNAATRQRLQHFRISIEELHLRDPVVL